MHIGQVSEVTEELHEAIQRLVPQLSLYKPPPTWDDLKALLASECSTLLAAYEFEEGSRVVGILSLTVYRVPTGLRSIIEDVIVDESMRGRGVGQALVQRALALARQAGAEGVSLTSNPAREAANRLYQSMGFELRKTKPYFYKLK